ncbi:immunoglobulin-like domain-containing protein, partial [Shewanella indica]|uniref:immunoglobulin-like domain-containing protein n=2 Tax=Shewanella indica TaxID=768528 RepID=UPI00399BDA59
TDDVYQDGETLSVNVTEAEGGNYEDLDLGNSVDTTVNDTIDTTTVTLTAPAEVNEGGQITYTATVNNTPETDLVLTLSNGASITIAAGQTEGTVTVAAPTDDVYQDGETLSVNVTGAEGGNYEDLDLGNSVDTTVNDTIDTTTITLTAPAEVSEGGSITYTATVNNAPETDLVLTLSNGASITIAAGQTEGTVTVDAPTDDVFVDAETLTVSIDNAQGGNFENLDTSDTASTLVNDTTDTVFAQISVDKSSVTEGGEITYTVTLVDANGNPVTLPSGASVSVALDWSGTATAADVDNLPPSVTISGDSQQSFTVNTINDGIYENSENLSVTISGVTDVDNSLEQLEIGSNNSADTTILDAQDAPVVRSVTGDSVIEGNANTFTVTLSTPSATNTKVTLSLSDGSAIVGTDTGLTYMVSFDGGTTYTAVTGNTVTVPPGATNFLVQVDTIDDTIFEGDENYSLNATANGAGDSGTAQITDNDSAPTVSSITGDTVVEGTANTFDVNLSNTASSATTLTLTLAGNSATKGVDFSDTEVTVTINGTAQTVSVNADGTFEVTVPANTDSFTVRVNTTDDTIFESTEDYTLSGTGANGTVTGTAQITDNDSAPTVSSITGDTVVEGTANTFDVNLSNTASSATTLTLTLAGNSATKGVDFSDTEVTVTINGTAQTVSVNADGTFEVTVPANTDSFTVQVNTTDDTIFESTEDYTLSGTGANGTVTGTAQITDNDSAPTVSSITGDTVVEGTANTFDVNLSNTASSATTLTLTLAGNSATKGVDFSDTEVTVTINGTAQTVSVNADGTFEVTVPANTDSFTVRVNTTDDTIFESTEDYTLSGTGANGTVTGTAQITDNDILGGGSINLSLQDADTVGDNHDTDSSFLTFTASGAADIIDFTFGPTSGITVSGLDGNITWLVDSSSGDLVGSIDGTPMIVLSLNGGVIGSGQTGNVSVTATLLDNLQHGSVPVDIDSINITGIVINAVDSLNNSASGTVNLTVADDEVVLIAGPLNGTNAPDTYIGTLDTSGVDQAYTSDLSGNVNGWDAGSQTYFGASDITAGGKTVFFFVDPNNPDQLFAYTSDENPATAYDASNPDQTLIFTLSTDPNSDSYQLDILQSIDKLKEIDIGALVGGKGGISGTVYVTYDNATGAYDIYNDPSKVPSDAEVAFTLYGRDGNGDLADVNGTDNGFGVANPWVSGGETLIVDYADTVASASFNFNVGNNDPMLVHYKAYDANGQLLGEGEIGPNEIISDLGAIAYIELSAVTPDGAKFQLTGTTAQEIVSSTEPLDLDFEVVVTDSDGDQTTGNLDIHLDAPGGAPVAIISHALASLDEFGLQDDNLDTDQQSLRFKAGDSELSDFGFNYQNGDFSGITVEGIRENFPLSWRLEGEYLIASMPGNGPNKDVLKISLDWSAIAAGSEGNIIVNAELIGNLPHSIDVDSLKISGIEIVGTDNNNQTAVSTLDVKVEKYTAAVDDYQEINEDQLASGNIFDNDTGELNNGQDLELASFTVAGDSQVYSAGEEVSVEGGTLVINLNGSYTFTPEANWNGTVPVITYVTNNGDTATLTIEVNSVNDAPIIVTTTNAVVSEEGLTNGLPDSNGSSDTTDSTTANGTIQLQDVDADALTVSLTPPSGITSGGQTVTWQWDAATHTLTGSVGNLAVMSVVLTPPAGNGSGDWDYQVKLLGPIDHPDTSIEDVKDLTFGVSVNDGNGGTVSGSFVVSVEDDAPYMPDTAPVTATATDTGPAIAYASGEVMAQWGADGQGSMALAGMTDTSLVTAGGEAVEVTLSGNTLLGQTDSGDLVFKLEFTPGTGHWDFYQYQTMQGTEDGDLDFAVTVTDADGDSYSGNIAVVPVFNYQVTEAGPGGQTLNLGNAEDIVIGDLDGSVVVPGQDYNIAFMVDSSGSIGYRAMEAMKLQLTQVFETLKASADSDNAGTVNIFLTDFDSQANLSVSVDLGDPDALSKLQTVIDSMDGDYWTGGGTNYEDVIKTTANWFHSDTALANSNAENLAFFITDGAPSVYQYYEDTNPIVNRKTGETLDDLVNVNNFTLGEEFYANIGGEARLIIDADGNLYQWSKDRGDWSPNYIGHIRAQGDGTYEISSTLNGNYWALQNALSALPLLTGNDVIVQAIGIGNNISTGTLQQFDSDGNVQTNVSADELAEAILGNEITDIPGSDTLDGGAGNDIIFGDVIRFDGIQGQGYSALKAFIAGELGQSDATDAEIHGYISEHPNLFDKSGINDMGDIIRGGEGSDILFGQGGNDELYGDNGNDMLFGGNGNDLLVGGNGDDWLTGGQGVDTFSWKAGETGTDHITDFELNKDKLDLSELLLGEEHNSLEQYFQFSVADGNTTISIDADLDGEFDQHIVLDGVDLFAEYGSDESDIINGLLGSNGDGPLLVDTQSANPGASYVSQSSSSGLEQSKPDEVY